MATFTNDSPDVVLVRTDPPVELQPGESCEIPDPVPPASDDEDKPKRRGRAAASTNEGTD